MGIKRKKEKTKQKHLCDEFYFAFYSQ